MLTRRLMRMNPACCGRTIRETMTDFAVTTTPPNPRLALSGEEPMPTLTAEEERRNYLRSLWAGLDLHSDDPLEQFLLIFVRLRRLHVRYPDRALCTDILRQANRDKFREIRGMMRGLCVAKRIE